MCYLIDNTKWCFYFGKIKDGIKMAIKEKRIEEETNLDAFEIKEVKKTKEKEVKKEKTKKEKNKKEKKNTKNKNKEVKKESWFKGVISEFKKVRWPNKKEMVKYSIATIVFILFFALFFYIIELIIFFIKEVM